jgi:eukaryotic-like serine/threonine-protein kinase
MPPVLPTRTASNGSAALPLREHPTEQNVSSHPPRVDTRIARPAERDERRYEMRSMLGRGGMGDVRVCRDVRIGRDVAMKTARTKSRRVRERFVREACLQGQLEHPSIVPVYDIGIDREGEPYFTMKRVRGLTLAEVLHRLGRADPEISARFSRRKLLTAFTAVCLTIDFAHQRGVMHRDLKPSNIMLGDFGEVYVLDWGVAALLDVEQETGEIELTAPHAAAVDAAGTPGYMAPEQIGGVPDSISARADIYALGVILFEILALDPLHSPGDRQAAIAATLAGLPAHPSERAPALEIPPELDAVCAKATAFVPEQRYATAREIHDVIEAFLDGDRDLELRKNLAATHAKNAAAALEQASSEDVEAEAEEEHRAKAMCEVGRAIALDASNEPARRLLVRLLTEPPRLLPAEARRAIEVARERGSILASRWGVLAHLSCLTTVPLLFALGLRDLELLVFVYTLTMIVVVLLAIVPYAKWSRSPFIFYLRFALTTVAIAFGSRLFGPFILLPALALTNTVTHVLDPHRLQRGALIAIGCSAVIIPAVLEWTGVIPPSYVFRDGQMCVVPQLTELPRGGTSLLLLLANAGIIVVAARFAGRVRGSLIAAEEKLHLYAWHLRQLLPVSRLTTRS